MRVALVTSYFDPHVGGVETHVRELARALVARGLDATVITADTDAAGPRGEVAGVPVIRVPPRSTLFKTPSMPGAIEAVVGGHFDLVHSHTPPPLAAWRAAKASRKARIPHVLTFHCDPEIPNPLGGLIVDAWRLTLGRSTLRRTDHLISTTASYASTSRSIWNYSPTVIPNAVDASFFRPGAPAPRVAQRLAGSPGFRLLCVGRLVQHKGIENLIDAMQFLPPPAHLVIAGDGDKRRDFEARARASPAGDRITFQGHVPLQDLPDLYRACDVFVLPSVSRLEAFGIVALEAMASGLPVVASDIPGVREVVDEGAEGYLANPLDPANLAARVNELLVSPLKRARFGRNGRAKVLREFSWERVAAQVERVYEQVLHGAKPSEATAPSAAAAA
jgi:glycosyltransferase involved in cell wall biosynthesis